MVGSSNVSPFKFDPEADPTTIIGLVPMFVWITANCFVQSQTELKKPLQQYNFIAREREDKELERVSVCEKNRDGQRESVREYEYVWTGQYV